MKHRPKQFRDKTKMHKLELIERGMTACHYCGTECGISITADHMRPISHGGKDEFSNIVPACAPCNNRKGSKLYKDFMEQITLEQLLRDQA